MLHVAEGTGLGARLTDPVPGDGLPYSPTAAYRIQPDRREPPENPL